MIVHCPGCETQFELPDAAYRPGRKARCSQCAHVFVLPDAGEEVPAEVPPFKEELPDSSPFKGELPLDTGPESALPSEEEPVSGGDTGLRETAPADPAAAPGPLDEDVVLPPSAPVKKKRNLNFLFIPAAVLVMGLVAYGAYLVVYAIISPPAEKAPEVQVDDRLGRTLGSKPAGDDASRMAAVARLTLDNIKQYTVLDNKHTGPMLVITGEVVNNFETPKSLILLEATLYDDNGQPLRVKQQYCGIELSFSDLQTLDKAAIESALKRQSDIQLNNVDIPPGGRVVFTTAFFELPRNARDFEIRIIDAQDP